MLLLNSVSAWIEVDGKELEQYGIEEDPERNQVTCWIATQADKNFSIIYRDNMEHREHSLCSRLELDGSYIKGKIVSSSATNSKSRNSLTARTAVQTGQRVTAESSCPFLFSKLELTDEDEFLNQSSTQLGEIRISIFKVAILERSSFVPVSSASGHAKVHERSKKAVTYCVSYGREVKALRRCHGYRVGFPEFPLVTFIFKYRDLGLLQANGIVPQPPATKKKVAVSGEVLDLTIRNDFKPEPVDEEVEIIDNKRSAVVRKRLKASYKGDEKPAKRIKRENVFVPIGEVIDLT